MNRMLIFSVHLKRTKESDVVGWESGSGNLIPGLLVWQRIQFIAKQILWVNSSSSSSILCDWKDAQAKTYFIYLKLGSNFEATFDITLCHGEGRAPTLPRPGSKSSSHHVHHHNKQSWISVSAAWLKAQAKYSF